jgi:biotin carboxyl carrier protein
MRYHVTIAGRSFEVDLSGEKPRVDGVEVAAELVRLPASSVRHLRLDGASITFSARPGEERGQWEVIVAGRPVSVAVVDERTRAIQEIAGVHEVVAEARVTAPMPGLVVRVEVAVGDRVRAGQGVVIVEAMKMENELQSPADGVVARVEVVAGQTVEKGAVLLVLD